MPVDLIALHNNNEKSKLKTATACHKKRKSPIPPNANDLPIHRHRPSAPLPRLLRLLPCIGYRGVRESNYIVGLDAIFEDATCDRYDDVTMNYIVTVRQMQMEDPFDDAADAEVVPGMAGRSSSWTNQMLREADILILDLDPTSTQK